ncbi:MAG: HU family DNA-binding protein [Acidimicrobiales bacterium]
MNKSELIEAVGSKAGLDKRGAERAVDAFVGTVMNEVRGGNKVTLIGFGTFTPKARAARMGRNPRTGEPVRVKASKGVGFSPGSTFKSELNSRAGARTASKSTKAASTGRTTKAAKSTKAAKAAKSTRAAAATKSTAKSATRSPARAVAKSATRTTAKRPAAAKSAKSTKAAKATRSTAAKKR